MDNMQRPDGTRMQAGLGRMVSLPLSSKVRTMPLQAQITQVYPVVPGDPIHWCVLVDVMTESFGGGQEVFHLVPVYNAGPYDRSTLVAGLPCLVWFKEGRATSPFVLGFGAWPGDNVSPTLPGESRSYDKSGSMERVTDTGAKVSITKGSNMRYTEEMVPGVGATPGAVSMSAKGRAMLKVFEGLKLKSYPDAGTNAIGYGHQIIPGDGLKPGDTIDLPRAESLLSDDIRKAELLVSGAGQRMGRDLGQLAPTQQDALISLAYNSPGAFNSHDSVFIALKEKRDADVPREMATWQKSEGHINAVLVERRALEGNLFANGVYP